MIVTRHILFFTCLICSLILSHEACADIKMPSVISDNMVLQQQATVNIWGKADPMETIKVSPSWNDKVYTTKADENGKWLVKIKTPQAVTNQSMSIQGNNNLKINNILIGEVWLCSGQSNMDFPVAKATSWRTGIVDEEEEMKDADYPEIRLFHVAQKVSPNQELDECEGQWLVCNRENLKTFSAVAFSFGRELYKKLDTPIGLIQSSWGGTPAEAWIKWSVINSKPIYSQLIKDYESMKKNYPADMERYKQDMVRNEQKKPDENNTEKPPKKPLGIYNPQALSNLWNGMISPLINYNIKGVIWYQGESNSDRSEDYKQVFTYLINSWRKEWKQGDLPFYFVQIAPHKDKSPLLREAQLKTWKTVKNTGMAVTTDVGDSTDIHPRNKRIPGERLAYFALAKTYNKDIPYSGPVYKSFRVKGNKVLLSFDYTNGELRSKGLSLTGFTIAGSDHRFHPAQAKIVGNTVEVSAPSVIDPTAVRYGWDNFFRVNLYNRADLPATPFRTDNWN